MPVSIIPGLRKTDLEGSIYTYIEDKLGLYIESGHRTISVRKANDIEVEELQLETGDPVGVAEQIGFLSNGAPFEYTPLRSVLCRNDGQALRGVNHGNFSI